MIYPDPTTVPPWHNDSGVAPTNAEVARWLATTSDANRDAWFTRVQDAFQESRLCWEQDHGGRLEQVERELRAALDRVDYLEAHWRAQ